MQAVGLLLLLPPRVPLRRKPRVRRIIAAGKLLVASRDLGDPNFAQTVVLLVHYDEDSVVGLVLNRRTKVPIARALEELKGAKSGRTAVRGRSGGHGRSPGAGALPDEDSKMRNTYSATCTW